MNYQAHRIGGVCATLITTTLLYQDIMGKPSTYVAIGVAVVGGAVGGLLPDIDHPTSRIGRRAPIISKFINSVCGHRGFTHTILANMLFAYLLFLLAAFIPDVLRGFYFPFALGLIIGYFSHLLLDMLTRAGIPLFYPFSSKAFRFAKLRSGTHDAIVIVLIILGTGVYLYYFNGL